MEMLVGSSFILEICSVTGYIFEVYMIGFYLLRIQNYEIFRLYFSYFSHVRLYMPPAQREKNKQNSKDEAIIVEEEEIEKAKNKESKEENSLIVEGIKDELKEEVHGVQDRSGE